MLLKFATLLDAVDGQMRELLTPAKLAAIVDLVPDEWLAIDAGFDSKSEQRSAYLNFFTTRLQQSSVFVQEALRARASHL